MKDIIDCKLSELIKKKCKTEYKGAFNIRVSPTLHEWLHQQAFMNNVSMNHYISVLLESAKESLEGNK